MALFIVIRRKVPRKLKCSTKKYLYSLLKKNLKFPLKDLAEEIANLYEICCVQGKVENNKKYFFFVNKLPRQLTGDSSSWNTWKSNNDPLALGKT